MFRKLWIAALAVAMLATLSAQDKGPYKPGGDVTPPKAIKQVRAEYTKEALKAKIQGSVMLKLVVDQTGVPRDIEVVKPLDPGLDKNAMLAASQWRFEPGKKDGKVVNVVMNMEMTFTAQFN